MDRILGPASGYNTSDSQLPGALSSTVYPCSTSFDLLKLIRHVQLPLVQVASEAVMQQSSPACYDTSNAFLHYCIMAQANAGMSTTLQLQQGAPE